MSQTILSLLDWRSETGQDLPMPAEDIAVLEARGHTVDLESGEIILNGATMAVESTVIGEATSVVLSHESEVGG